MFPFFSNEIFFFNTNPKYISAEQKASNESTCANLIGIEDGGQYPICPKPTIIDIRNRVSFDILDIWTKNELLYHNEQIEIEHFCIFDFLDEMYMWGILLLQ